MMTARCVANHTVPSSKTTPSRSSAAIAPIRGSGDSIEVTYSVACTRINMALSVMATIISVVRIDRKTRLIVEKEKCPIRGPGNEPREAVGSLPQPGPVVSDQDGIARVGWVVLHAGLLAADQALEFHLAFQAGNVLCGVIGHSGNGIAVGD
jgi:hypothetical protein